MSDNTQSFQGEQTSASFYRHESNMGTVMTYMDKVGDEIITKKLLVLDAKYRTVSKFGTFDVDTPPLKKYKLQTTNDPKRLSLSKMTSNDITECYNYLYDSCSAKYNDDVWMFYNNTTDMFGTEGVPAVSYCRNIKVRRFILRFTQYTAVDEYLD